MVKPSTQISSVCVRLFGYLPLRQKEIFQQISLRDRRFVGRSLGEFFRPLGIAGSAIRLAQQPAGLHVAWAEAQRFLQFSDRVIYLAQRKRCLSQTKMCLRALGILFDCLAESLCGILAFS